jgi:hypothetical protein
MCAGDQRRLIEPQEITVGVAFSDENLHQHQESVATARRQVQKILGQELR